MTDAVWESCREQCRIILQTGDEPIPVAFFFDGTKMEVAALLMDKPQWRDYIKKIAETVKAVEVGVIMSAWVTRVRDDELDRRSMAIFLRYERDGTSDMWACSYELVGQDDDAEVINPGQWERADGVSEDYLLGGLSW